MLQNPMPIIENHLKKTKLQATRPSSIKFPSFSNIFLSNQTDQHNQKPQTPKPSYQNTRRSEKERYLTHAAFAWLAALLGGDDGSHPRRDLSRRVPLLLPVGFVSLPPQCIVTFRHRAERERERSQRSAKRAAISRTFL